jgi:hypothetical protein
VVCLDPFAPPQPKKCDTKLGYEPALSQSGDCSCNTQKNFQSDPQFGQCVCMDNTSLNTETYTCEVRQHGSRLLTGF